MELKSRPHGGRKGGIYVLIVPLWNWNCSCYDYLQVLTYVLIVPLWNWNRKSEERRPQGVRVLIVPLWNWNVVLTATYRVLSCSNRTFMELKSACAASRPPRHPVLIVPLWNWNHVIAVPCEAAFMGSNRTFMELKSYQTTAYQQKERCSNRTFMELKLLEDATIFFKRVRF